jgi:hypothetical protein
MKDFHIFAFLAAVSGASHSDSIDQLIQYENAEIDVLRDLTNKIEQTKADQINSNHELSDAELNAVDNSTDHRRFEDIFRTTDHTKSADAPSPDPLYKRQSFNPAALEAARQMDQNNNDDSDQDEKNAVEHGISTENGVEISTAGDSVDDSTALFPHQSVDASVAPAEQLQDFVTHRSEVEDGAERKVEHGASDKLVAAVPESVPASVGQGEGIRRAFNNLPVYSTEFKNALAYGTNALKQSLNDIFTTSSAKKPQPTSQSDSRDSIAQDISAVTSRINLAIKSIFGNATALTAEPEQKPEAKPAPEPVEDPKPTVREVIKEAIRETRQLSDVPTSATAAPDTPSSEKSTQPAKSITILRKQNHH